MFERLPILIRSPRGLAVAAAAWLICFAWARPLAVPDEGRYTDIARWMVLTGDWVIPRLNGLPFIQKPPLYFWLEAIGLSLAGTSLLVARWVSIAAGLVTAYAVYRFTGSRFGESAARWSLIVLLTSLFFFGAAQFASPALPATPTRPGVLMGCDATRPGCRRNQASTTSHTGCRAAARASIRNCCRATGSGAVPMNLIAIGRASTVSSAR